MDRSHASLLVEDLRRMHVKKGDVEEAAMEPLYPALHRHKLGTLVPLLFTGQATAVQDPVKKGAAVEATMVPLYPALHVHPAGMLLPAGKSI
jgi:hypothetical protein